MALFPLLIGERSFAFSPPMKGTGLR